MRTAKFTVALAGAGLLALVSTAPLMAEGAMSSEHAAHNAMMASSMREVPLGLLIKTPDIPHGVSFNRQVAAVASGLTPT